MKSLKESFEESYVAVEVPCDNKRGFKVSYEYVGEWYVWNLSGQELRREKWLIGLLCAGSALLYLCASLQHSYLNYSIYVMLPALFSVAAFLFEAIGSVQFCAAKEKMTNLDYSGINSKLRLATLIHAGLLFATGIICIVLTLAYYGASPRSFLIAFFYLLSGLCSAGLYVNYHKLSYRLEKNNTLNEKKGSILG